MQNSKSMQLVVQCNDENTGSFGCVLRHIDGTSNHSKKHQNTKACCNSHNSQQKTDNHLYIRNATMFAEYLNNNPEICKGLECVDVASGSGECCISIEAFRDSLTQVADKVALKLVRAQFKNASKTASGVFYEEVTKVKLLESRLSPSLFDQITTYRRINHSYAYIIRPKSGSKIQLYIQHKPTYKSIPMEAFYILIQESCVTSIQNIVSTTGETNLSRSKDNTNSTNNNNTNSTNFSKQANRRSTSIAWTKSLIREFEENVSYSLRVLHSAGLVHSDIKPNNIVYCPKSSPLKFKLIDYGLVQDVLQLSTVPARVVGTKMYMSPFYVATILKSVPAFMKDAMLELMKNFRHHRTIPIFRSLLKLHLTGIQTSGKSNNLAYIMMKNDEYAYMITLCNVYDETRSKYTLRKAAALAMSPDNVFVTPVSVQTPVQK